MAYLEAGMHSSLTPDLSDRVNDTLNTVERKLHRMNRNFKRVNWGRVASDVVSVGLRVLPLPVVVGASIAFGDPRPVFAQDPNCVSSPQVLAITGANPKNLPSISVTSPFTGTLKACKEEPGVYQVIRSRDGQKVGESSQFIFAKDNDRFAVQATLFSRLSSISEPIVAATKTQTNDVPSIHPNKDSTTDITPYIAVGGMLWGVGVVVILFLRHRRKNQSGGGVDGEGRPDRTVGGWLSGNIPGDFMQNAEVTRNDSGEARITYGHWDDTGPPSDRVITGSERENILKRFIKNAKKNN